ncbi:uncharacterized protein LOC109856384 isoform X2 [Pseudomyrmex gracilis]|uniref:uncharacterized protein LOC109856384 isoform X2 n=1 Tax=Pseudomyrmex gracilis TaxID=219809 RepID=UPI000995602E|nr:uncharacterized protein LOC109856384 isoform X2 [Pseudomyrmex gracilis]
MSETRHYPIRSVSDLYAADEIEVLLLEEIRDLEPPPAIYSKPEDIQDFEIGSRTGGRISSQSSELDSPGVHSTVHSWDSHANYHGHYGNSDHRPGSSSNALPWSRAHVVIYCDIRGHLKTATGVVRLLLLISSAACLATLCTSGTTKVSLFMLPLAGRLRVMIFVAVFCLLITAVLLFLDISHVIYILPLNWAKLNAIVFTGIGLSFTASSALLACTVWEYHSGGWHQEVPKSTRLQLSAAAGLGLSCALFAFLLSWIQCRNSSSKDQDSRSNTPTQLYKPVDSSSSGVTLKERSPKRPASWAVKNQQQSKKRNTDSDTNTSNGGHRGSNHERFKQGANRKDHWATAKQHILDTHTNNEESQQEDEMRLTRRPNDSEIERRRRKRRKEGDSSSTVDGNTLSSSKIDASRGSVDETKTRRVPRKLPLQQSTMAQPQSWSDAENRNNSTQISNKTKQMSVIQNNDAQNCCDVNVVIVNETRSVNRVTRNGLRNWETECTSSNGVEEAADVNVAVRNTMFAKPAGQWHPPPDDVQPCSSKTIDPYSFA